MMLWTEGQEAAPWVKISQPPLGQKGMDLNLAKASARIGRRGLLSIQLDVSTVYMTCSKVLNYMYCAQLFDFHTRLWACSVSHNMISCTAALYSFQYPLMPL